MKDALGGVFNYVILFTSVLLVTSFVLFGINYYRAFTIKNRIISTIEAYEGNLDNPNLKEKISDYINRSGYNIGSQKINSKKCTPVDEQGWCYNVRKSRNDNTKYIYEVRTFVNIDLPFFNKFFNSNDIFSVAGETKPIKRK